MRTFKLVNKKKFLSLKRKKFDFKSDEALAKVLYSGVCGSDLSVYLGHHPYKKAPTVLGHEFLGKITNKGSKISKIKKNDLVTTLSYNFCNKCNNCKSGLTNHCNYKTTPSYKNWDGTFADFFLCKKNSIYKLKKNIHRLDAVMMEPFAICNHAINLVPSKKINNTLILGAGNMGLATLMLTKTTKRFSKIGCVDLFNSRKKLVKKLKGDYFIKYSRKNLIKKIPLGIKKKGIDLIFITCDYKNVLADAFEIIKPNGTIIIISYFKNKFKIDYNQVVKKEINLKGSFLSTIKDFREVEKLILKKKLVPRKIISHIYPFNKIVTF